MPSDCSDRAHEAEEMALWIEGHGTQASVPEFRSPTPILKVGCVWGPSIISVLEAETGNPQSWLASYIGGNSKFGVQQETLLQHRR